MRRPGTVALAIWLGVLGCAHAPKTEKEEPAAPRRTEGEAIRGYFPLAEGNVWRYQGRFLGQDVQREISILRQEGPWWLDSTGERLMVDAEGLRSPERYLLKGPLQAGTAWRSVVSVSSTENYEISAVGITVRVPAGVFEACVRVVASNRVDERTTLFKEDSYCPGVGLARLRTWMDVAGKGRIPQVELDLQSYDLGERR